ncbi:hypothetical protein OEA41_004974 [Lepraria neglecta]|uniref:F-box domain-containing protein n=1 Tax=Lepraria neglecta TaxID=209136 RepID=A0AAD9YYY9_9LECA|nr:hypothetical protein OEA41_004974 [Lepraria neglecta]
MADKMQISDLPDDILHRVFPHIHGEESLYALALANCRLNILTRPYICRDVDLRRAWPGFLEVNSMPLLCTVTLYDQCTTINDTLQFMQLENVDNIQVNALNVHAKNEALVGRTQRKATHLLTLDLNGFFHVPAEMLAQLINFEFGWDLLDNVSLKEQWEQFEHNNYDVED